MSETKRNNSLNRHQIIGTAVVTGATLALIHPRPARGEKPNAMIQPGMLGGGGRGQGFAAQARPIAYSMIAERGNR